MRLHVSVLVLRRGIYHGLGEGSGDQSKYVLFFEILVREYCWLFLRLFSVVVAFAPHHREDFGPFMRGVC